MNKKIFTSILLTFTFVFMLGMALADPNGASTVTPGTSERATADSPQSHTALAGNVTELTIVGNSITQTWQGYFGNISGAIELADASGDVMYNWSLASPQGEVFASTDSTVTWTGIKCFNWTENGTTLETAQNIDSAVDGINETFTDANSHAAFSVGSTSIGAGDCMSADIFDSTGASVDGTFEEVLLSQADGNPVFAALLEEDVSGFDSTTHDFQMLVLEDGHEGDSSTTTYYFYVELE